LNFDSLARDVRDSVEKAALPGLLMIRGRLLYRKGVEVSARGWRHFLAKKVIDAAVLISKSQ